MALTYFEISYPNFILGSIIDPEEANQNNYEFVDKINTIITANNTNEVEIARLESVKSTIVYVDDKISNLSGAGRTTETIRQNALNLISHKTSTDHDSRYYTKTLLDGGQLDNRYYTKALLNSGQLDNRYYTETEVDTKLNNYTTKAENNLKANKADVYTKEELTPWLSHGDTSIKEEVYTIVTSDNGDGTFNYTDGLNAYIGEIDTNGYQVFELREGYYDPGSNRVEVIINDTIRRSVRSGGILEVTGTKVALTQPEGAGAEITIKYYERIGIVAEYNIKLSSTKPPQNNGQTMWFRIIG